MQPIQFQRRGNQPIRRRNRERRKRGLKAKNIPVGIGWVPASVVIARFEPGQRDWIRGL